MKRRSFLGSIAAALGLSAAVPAVAERPKWEAASGAILDDLKAIECATVDLFTEPPVVVDGVEYRTYLRDQVFVDGHGWVWLLESKDAP